jgi:hypothetical protein
LHILRYFIVDVSSEKNEKRTVDESGARNSARLAAAVNSNGEGAKAPPIRRDFVEEASAGTTHACAFEAGTAMKQFNSWMGVGADSPSLVPPAQAVLHPGIQRAEAEIRRLKRCLELKDQQLCELRKALAHSATIHSSVEDRLQRELDSLRIMGAVEEFEVQWDRSSTGPTERGMERHRAALRPMRPRSGRTG